MCITSKSIRRIIHNLVDHRWIEVRHSVAVCCGSSPVSGVVFGHDVILDSGPIVLVWNLICVSVVVDRCVIHLSIGIPTVCGIKQRIR